MYIYLLSRQVIVGVVIQLFVLFGALGTSAETQAVSQEPTPREIVAASDRVRAPQQAFSVVSKLIEFQEGERTDSVTLAIASRYNPEDSQFYNVVRYLEPAKDVDKLVLYRGADLWFYDPSSRASVRISPQQRLIGQASTGDVLTVNFAADYDAKIVAKEVVKNLAGEDRDSWHLDLSAARAGALYGRIELWVDRENFNPVKSLFYADSGRLLKVAYYGGLAEQLGRLRVTKTVIVDAVDRRLVTMILSSDFSDSDVPDIWFSREYLPRLPRW